MKTVFHKFAISLFVLILLVAVDAMRSGFEPDTLFRAAAGESVPVGGKLSVSPEDLAEIRDFDSAKAAEYLEAKLDTPDAQVQLLELQGRIWRGEVTVADEVRSGEYSLQVLPRGANPQEDATLYRLRLFPDGRALRRDLPSFCERDLGVRPFWLFVGLLPLGLGCLGLSFLFSSREDARRQALGLGSIYKLARRKHAWEVLFGLGSRHGVRPGERLLLLDSRRRVVGDLVAAKVGPEASHAEVGLETAIEPGFLVARADAPGLGPGTVQYR